jgi:hypothetical protein
MRGICKLCLEEKELIKSHIIPRSLLRKLSEGEKFDGQIIAVHRDKPRPTKRPGGTYDRLLCERCDRSLGIYDDHIQKFIATTELILDPSGLGWTINNIQINKVRLFCMSYLWRASIAKVKEFEDVSLGKQHEESLRKLIYSGDPGEAGRYAIFAGKFISTSSHNHFSKIIMAPHKIKMSNITFYEVFLPNLFQFRMKVDQQTLPEDIKDNVLGTDKFMAIYNLGAYEKSKAHKMLMQTARKATQEEKNRKNY